jgi:glucose uptake protein GlcU
VEVSSSYVFGIVCGLFSAVFFGFYAIPRKYSKMGKYAFLVSMCIGVAVCTFFVGALGKSGLLLTREQIWLSLASGVLWSIGTFTFILSIDAIGIVKATPIKNLTGVMGAVSGVLVFGEFGLDQPLQLGAVLLGSTVIAVSAVVISRVYPEKDKILEGEKLDSRALIKGVILSLAAAIAYTAYTIPGKLVFGGDNGELIYLYIRYMGAGTLLGAIIGFLLFDRDFSAWCRKPLKEHFVAVLGGMLWTIAFLLVVLGIDSIGLSVAWPLGNLNTIVSVGYGVLVLREVKTTGQSGRIVGGLVLAALGVGLLVFARI